MTVVIKACCVRTLHERLDWLLDYVRAQEPDKVTSWRSFATEAGLSPATLTQIRRKSIATGGGTTGHVDSYEAIARRYGVALPWLVAGNGLPFPDAQVDELEAVLATGEWSPEAEAAARAAHGHGHRLSRQEWRKYLDSIPALAPIAAAPAVAEALYWYAHSVLTAKANKLKWDGAAKALGISREQLDDLIRNRERLTDSEAAALAKMLGTTAGALMADAVQWFNSTARNQGPQYRDRVRTSRPPPAGGAHKHRA